MRECQQRSSASAMPSEDQQRVVRQPDARALLTVCWVILRVFPNITCPLKHLLQQNITCPFNGQLLEKHGVSILRKISSCVSASAKHSHLGLPSNTSVALENITQNKISMVCKNFLFLECLQKKKVLTLKCWLNMG